MTNWNDDDSINDSIDDNNILKRCSIAHAAISHSNSMWSSAVPQVTLQAQQTVVRLFRVCVKSDFTTGGRSNC